MKAGLEKEMRSDQERREQMTAGLEKKLETGQEEMKKEIREHEIGDVKEEVDNVQGKISVLEKRLCDLEERPINSMPSSEVMYSRTTVKPLTFDRQTSWSVSKTQFDVGSSSNGWTDHVKASQLVASFRGSSAEVLQGIPAGNWADLTTIERALKFRFGDIRLTKFYRTELKTRWQKLGESLQVLAADVERLMSLAYAECPLDIRESLAAQYFVDAIRDEDTQHSTRLMDAKDLKSTLAYSMKYEAARTVSKASKHVRSIEVVEDSEKKEDKFESLFNRVRFYWDRLRADVEKWCRECHACGARKGPKTRTKGRLQRYNVGAPFERMALDILGPFPVTANGNRYVLVLTDYFMKWLVAIPIPDQGARPNQIDWDKHLPLFLLAYGSAVHEATGWTLSEMLFGRTLRLPCDILFGSPTDTPSSPNKCMNDLKARLESVHAFATERIKLASEKMKTRYDSGATEHLFKEGYPYPACRTVHLHTPGNFRNNRHFLQEHGFAKGASQSTGVSME
ncbi:Gypsy retrotransposon integrase-like protein 1 [Argiope bruennichi]|uniref:Gypsy retrotransposon integrase-like protein 1 n=1 Tax=Argiope bruennichi TaxID=94029 RepID=A0A8T0E6J6_ARGBR|nr:Gypsy retrotransposon integrase-like protein 1 [Argiope bruennichi]